MRDKKENKIKEYNNLIKKALYMENIEEGMILNCIEICQLLNIPPPNGSSTRRKLAKEFLCIFEVDMQYLEKTKKYKIIRKYEEEIMMENFKNLIIKDNTGKHNNHNVSRNNDKFLSLSIELFKRFVKKQNKFYIETSSHRFLREIGLITRIKKDFYSSEMLRGFSTEEIEGAIFWNSPKDTAYINLPEWNGIIDKEILTSLNRGFLYDRFSRIFKDLIEKLKKEGIIDYTKTLISVVASEGEYIYDIVPSEVLEEIKKLNLKIKYLPKVYDIISKKYGYEYMFYEYYIKVNEKRLNDYTTIYSNYEFFEVVSLLRNHIIKAVEESFSKYDKIPYYTIGISMEETNKAIERVKKSCDKLKKEYSKYVLKVFTSKDNKHLDSI